MAYIHKHIYYYMFKVLSWSGYGYMAFWPLEQNVGWMGANNGERNVTKGKNEISWLSCVKTVWVDFCFTMLFEYYLDQEWRRWTNVQSCCNIVPISSNALWAASNVHLRLASDCLMWKKKYFWKQQCMLLATGKYRISFQLLPAPHSLQNQNQNKTNEMSQPGALVNEEFHGATASCVWLQIDLKVELVSEKTVHLTPESDKVPNCIGVHLHLQIKACTRKSFVLAFAIKPRKSQQRLNWVTDT